MRGSEDVLCFELARTQADMCGHADQVAFGQVHKTPRVAAPRTSRLALETQPFIHSVECIVPDV